jgi:hypothetical protein
VQIRFENIGCMMAGFCLNLNFMVTLLQCHKYLMHMDL